MIRGTLWRALTGITLFMVAGTALADSAVNTGGFGAWIIDALFEAGTITNQPAQAGIIGTTLIPLSLICMLVAVVIIVSKSIQHLLVVAQAKDVDQSPVSMTWAPLHMVIAVVLIMPLPSGYSMGQYAAIWLANQSNTLGNITSERALGYFESRGAITPPILPEINSVAKGLVASQICRVLNNKTSDFVESQGGAPFKIKTRELTTMEMASIGGNPDKYLAGGGLTRAGSTFYKESASSGRWGAPIVDSYCGAVLIQYTAETEGNFFGENAVDMNLINANGTGNSEAAKCMYSPACMAGSDIAHKGYKEAAVAAFTSAHGQASQAFLRHATESGPAADAATTLLWDMDAYFKAKLDADDATQYMADQVQEREKIDEAVGTSVQLIDKMHTDIYQAYASSLAQFQTNRNDQGNNFLDTVKQVGWPVFGLYWFQYTNFSQQVMDSVNIQTMYTGDIDQFLDAYFMMLDDPYLEGRIRNRINTFTTQLTKELQNSRFDASPGSASSDIGSLSTADISLNRSKDALEIRESFPAIRDELIGNARSGAMGPQNVVQSIKQSINSFTKGTLFPYLVAPLRQDNLVNALVNTGHNIIMVSEWIYVFKSGMEAYKTTFGESAADNEIDEAGGGIKGWAINKLEKAPVLGSVITGVKDFLKFVANWIAIVFNDFAKYWFYVFLAGLFLAFYMPAMIMIQWLIGLVTWVIYIIEATVVIPLWGLLFTADMGQKAFAPQTAQQGFVHLLSILVYPSLMVIGFVIGLKIIDLISLFIVDFLIVGFLNGTDGYMFGLLSLGTGLIILGFACYQIITRVFSLTLELNDHAMSWIGNRQGFGEGQVENSTRAAVVGAIGKVEMAGRRVAPGDDNGMSDIAKKATGGKK